MRSRIYGDDRYRFGHVLATVTLSSHAQARLMQQMLEREMRERAGRPEESALAAWYNDIERTRSRARREKWVGWECPL